MKNDITESIPISWLCKSKRFASFLRITPKRELHIADFAAGENDEVPLFVHRKMKDCLHIESLPTITIYCTDLHSLRIESLFDKLIEQDIGDGTRIVLSRFESMNTEASFPDVQIQYLEQNQVFQNPLDIVIMEMKQIPNRTFDIGFLNNDVIGYLFEYYKEYTDAERSIRGIHSSMAIGGLLIVSQPCSLWPMDNIDMLEGNGFSFVEGFDVEMKTGVPSEISRQTDFRTMGKLGHYTILIFETLESQ